MIGRPCFAAERLAAACALSIVSSHCGSEDEKTPKPGPAGPPSIRIVQPADGATVALDGLPHGGVPVTVELQNWTLRPPAACKGEDQCGYVVLWVDAAAPQAPDVVASTTLLVVELANRPDPLGQHRFHVEIRNDDGTTATGDAGQPLFDEVSVTVVSRSDAGDASFEASVDARSDANADGSWDAGAEGAADVSADAPEDGPGDSGGDASPDTSTKPVDAFAETRDASATDTPSEAGDASQDRSSDTARDAGGGG